MVLSLTAAITCVTATAGVAADAVAGCRLRSVDKASYVTENEAILRRLPRVPGARLSRSYSIGETASDTCLPVANGEPYGSYTTTYVYRTSTPQRRGAVVRYYRSFCSHRDGDGWPAPALTDHRLTARSAAAPRASTSRRFTRGAVRGSSPWITPPMPAFATSPNARVDGGSAPKPTTPPSRRRERSLRRGWRSVSFLKKAFTRAPSPISCRLARTFSDIRLRTWMLSSEFEQSRMVREDGYLSCVRGLMCRSVGHPTSCASTSRRPSPTCGA